MYRKVFNIFFIVLFLVSAALQYNDEDPYLWMPIYLCGAVLCYLALREIYRPWMFIAGILFYATYALILLFIPDGAYAWFTEHNAENIAASMKASQPWIEKTREFFGLLLLIIALSLNVYWFSKSFKN